MARKNLLKGLIEEASKPEAESKPPAPSGAPRDRRARGAIGAVSQSIQELRANAVIEIDPFDVLAGGVNDRLDDDAEDNEALMHSIRTYGQQVPVLVRPHPEQPGKYQIVYGRRRVLALRDLGLQVKALVRELQDDELLMAQGQENTARKDLSFIERANFARQMRDMGYKRDVIGDALNSDKTLISRLLSVADAFEPELIHKIGAAPSAGRDRWMKLARLYRERDYDPETAGDMISVAAPTGNSDARFDALMGALEKEFPDEDKPRTRPQVHEIALPGSSEPARAVRRGTRTVITIPGKDTDGFDQWLVANLSDIHRNWTNGRGE